MNEAEEQLAKDLAELQALMAEHSDISGADELTSASATESPTEQNFFNRVATTNQSGATMGSGDVKGSMLGGRSSDDDDVSPSSSSMSEATFESEDDDDDIFFG